MNRRLQIPFQLTPPLTRIPLRSLPVLRTHVRKPACFVRRFAVVGGFDEGFKAESIGFLDTPIYKLAGGAATAVAGVDEEHC